MNAIQRSVRFGWWSLLCWLALGMALEALHGFKIGWYLDVVNETRRLQWRLAHTHGTLIALVNLLLAATGRGVAGLDRAATCLRWAGILMPVGFLAGGALAMGPDPGLPIVLVPVGAALLFAGVLLAARAMTAAAGASAAEPEPPRAEGKPGKRKEG